MNWIMRREAAYIFASLVVGVGLGMLWGYFFWQKVCPALGVLKWGQ